MQPSWFPFDIVYGILQYCDVSTLLEVALASRDYQSPAESFIYRTILFDNYDCDHKNCHCQNLRGRVEKCLKSLATHPYKACHTRVLHLQLGYTIVRSGDDPFFDILATALLSVTQLEVLQLKFIFDSYEDDLVELLSTLRRCTFSLRTIGVPHTLNPVKWARFHDNLQEVRFHPESGWYPDLETISVYRQWTAHSSHRLIIWSIRYQLFSRCIVAFPMLNPCWSACPIWESLSNIPSEFTKAFYDSADLFVNSVSKETLIGNLKSLNESFPAVKYLCLYVEEAQSYGPSTVLSTALSFLPRLTMLTLQPLNIKKLTGVSVGFERELQLAHSWAEVCPKLMRISFLSGNTLDRGKGLGWKTFEL